jgi:hypothetical protein
VFQLRKCKNYDVSLSDLVVVRRYHIFSTFPATFPPIDLELVEIDTDNRSEADEDPVLAGPWNSLFMKFHPS